MKAFIGLFQLSLAIIFLSTLWETDFTMADLYMLRSLIIVSLLVTTIYQSYIVKKEIENSKFIISLLISMCTALLLQVILWSLNLVSEYVQSYISFFIFLAVLIVTYKTIVRDDYKEIKGNAS